MRILNLQSKGSSIYYGLSSLWVSHTGSACDWYALQEALYKCMDIIQGNTITYAKNYTFLPPCCTSYIF